MATAAQQNRTRDAIAIGGVLVGVYLLVRGRDGWDDTDVGPDQAATISRSQARMIADAVFAALYANSTFWWDPFVGSWTEDEALVIASLTDQVIKTDGDVLRVADAYGARGMWSGPELTLFQAVIKYLKPDEVQEINDAWLSRGITLQI